MIESPFHVGEQQVQTRVGVRDAIEPWARRVVRPFMPDQHREFYAQLPFVVAAARDRTGRPWASLLAGQPGFIKSPDDRNLLIEARPLQGDALESSLVAGSKLGLLGIEPTTRRRNRANGTITETGANELGVSVDQTFGNCPQYITERKWHAVDVDPARSSASRHERLDAEMQAWIRSADTFFIASGYSGEGGNRAANGMDASHRGGAPGFVKVLSDTRLVFPDYAGNRHFNTIGNLVMDPRVGLLFVDFRKGDLLQITGTATIDWASGELAAHPGAQRLVTIDVAAIVRLSGVLPLRWGEPGGAIRALQVLRKTRESDDVFSFELIARDGGPLPDFEAGQYLPIELRITGQTLPVNRTYTLSIGPGLGHYRISVKRESQGMVSRFLHDVVAEGDIINARWPAGDFVVTPSGRSAVLVSAGIGVTPMVSMLHQLSAAADNRAIVFIHGARDGAHHPLAREVRTLAAARPNVTVDVAYSQPRAEDVQNLDYHRVGRVTGDVIEELVSGLDADFYICGPISFLSDISTALNARGVEPDRIRTETFGPAGGTAGPG
ncbi:MAG TPA: pyridoxamine 5'-phosphate oxidase family protein [Woeseiaceae bacterium]|nr:pyridoxamine 5'-phosphate oxidase family protein [Woeseiaceae bacterium]